MTRYDDDDDFDDGGTPGWRARHPPPTIVVHPTMRAAFRELLRRQPLLPLWIGLSLGIGLYLFFALEFVGFLIYVLLYRLFTGTL